MNEFITRLLLGTIWISLVSCTHYIERKDKAKEENFALTLIENFLQKGASFADIKKTLGEPSEMYQYEDAPKEKVYAYNNKDTNFKEWSFAVNEKGEVIWLNHKPWSNNPLLDRVEILPQTWKKYRCEKKTRPDTRVDHVIDYFTFFECAGGKMRAYYNIHGEIGTIAVFR